MLAHLRPHLRPLILGLVAAIGVSAFYTFSISSVIPLLKVVFADHETLADWLHRAETQRRLGIVIAADLPDDPDGLVITRVRPESLSSDALSDGDRIVAVQDESPGSYALMRSIAGHGEQSIAAVVVSGVGGERRETELQLQPYHWWSGALCRVAALLPSGKDADSRLRTLAIVTGGLVLITLLGGLCRLRTRG